MAALLSAVLLVAVAALAGVGAADPGHGKKGDDHGDRNGMATRGSGDHEYGSGGKQYGRHRVPMCHKGHTIWVALPAVKAHLRHHDRAGSC